MSLRACLRVHAFDDTDDMVALTGEESIEELRARFPARRTDMADIVAEMRELGRRLDRALTALADAGRPNGR